MFGTAGHVAVLVGAVLLIAWVVTDTVRRRRRGEEPWRFHHVAVLIAMTLTAAGQVSALT